jgi:Holliday junction resolvasome RuvABC endonuclease subunit
MALLTPSYIEVRDLPVHAVSATNELDSWGVIEMLREFNPDQVAIEFNHAMPSNGSKANFSQGTSLGILLCAATGLEVPVVRLRPQEWQAAVGLMRVPSTKRKAASRARAIEMFPRLRDELRTVSSHNRADAVLIAEAARRLSVTPLIETGAQ